MGINKKVFIKRVKTKHNFVIVKNIKKGVCPICKERKKLESHHLIPKRLLDTNNPLRTLKINICRNCHFSVHPENKYLMVKSGLISRIKLKLFKINYLSTQDLNKI